MTTQERDLAYKVRHALNEQIEHLPQNVINQLETSRGLAIARKKAVSPLRVFVREMAFVGQIGAFFGNPASHWLTRLGVAATLAVLVSGIMSIYHVQEQHQLKETAQMEAAVLSDELPPNAYLDPGFKNFLNKRGI